MFSVEEVKSKLACETGRAQDSAARTGLGPGCSAGVEPVPE